MAEVNKRNTLAVQMKWFQILKGRQTGQIGQLSIGNVDSQGFNRENIFRRYPAIDHIINPHIDQFLF